MSRGRRSGGPAGAPRARQGLADVGDLAGGDLVGQEAEDGGDRPGGVVDRVGHEGAIDFGEEGLEVALLHGHDGRAPLLVVDAADQRRQLGAEIGGLVDGEVVAEGVQDGPEQAIGAGLVAPAEPVVDVVDPDMGLLDGLIDSPESAGAHGSTSCFRDDGQMAGVYEIQISSDRTRERGTLNRARRSPASS